MFTVTVTDMVAAEQIARRLLVREQAKDLSYVYGVMYSAGLHNLCAHCRTPTPAGVEYVAHSDGCPVLRTVVRRG